MRKNNFFTLRYENGSLTFLDQTKLPFLEEYVSTRDYRTVIKAIKELEIRGAPAIGVAAAFAAVLAARSVSARTELKTAFDEIRSARPTAVNLMWAVDSLKLILDGFIGEKITPEIITELENAALRIHQDDIEKCRAISLHGASLFQSPVTVLTHCNAGALATGGEGTAVGVIAEAFRQGNISFVYADETRPILQGSRLTAFELASYGIPYAVLPDSASAYLMQQGKIHAAITGADRITRFGDAANKIGTYQVALSCFHHNIPFYVAAPTSTIDTSLEQGCEIPIEQRSALEVTSVHGTPVTRSEYPVFNPAFDVTPHSLITAIITEKGVCKPPYDFLK